LSLQETAFVKNYFQFLIGGKNGKGKQNENSCNESRCDVRIRSRNARPFSLRTSSGGASAGTGSHDVSRPYLSRWADHPDPSFFNFFVGGEDAWSKADVVNINGALDAASQLYGHVESHLLEISER
jgi:hypothetical protein